MNTKELDRTEEAAIKMEVSDYAFNIKKEVQRAAYWNATKYAHELYEFLRELPYVEADNPLRDKDKRATQSHNQEERTES